MSIRVHGLRFLLFLVASLGVSALLVLGLDRAVPWVCSIPIYTPALSTMGIPNTTGRFVSSDFDYTAHINSL